MSADESQSSDNSEQNSNQLNEPLHLQSYLAPCTDKIDEVIRKSVGHPVGLVCSLNCPCITTGVMRAVKPVSALEQRTAAARQKNIESSRSKIDLRQPENEDD